MSGLRVWRAAGAAGALLAGVVAIAGCTAPPAPEADPTLRKAVQPVVHDALIAAQEKDGGQLADDSSLAATARWFCAEKIIEIRELEDGSVKVGLDMVCSELAARDGTLVEGSGVHAPRLMELSREGTGKAAVYRVRRHDSAPDGAGHDAWIGRSFSEGGAEVVRHGDWDGTAQLEAAARTHFRLPSDAPVTTL